MHAFIYLLRSVLSRSLDISDLSIRAIKQPDVWCDYTSSVRRTVFAGRNVVNGRSRVTDSNVGRFTYFGPECRVLGAAIGSFCSIGPRVSIGLGRHPSRGWFSTAPCFFSAYNQATRTFVDSSRFEEIKPITIGNDVWIGANAIVSDGIRISDGAIIGAGAVITKDVPPYAVCLGLPAKIVRYRYDAQTVTRLINLKWWEWDEATLKNTAFAFQHEESIESVESRLKELEAVSLNSRDG